MARNGYGAIPTSSTLVPSTASNGEEKRRERRKSGKTNVKMDEDFDINAFLAANSVSSITKKYTPQPSATDPSKSSKGKEKDGDCPPPRNSEATKTTNKEGKLVHRVALTDTLEGIALMYNVQVADLKRVNRLFSTRDMFARRELVIPDEEVPPEEIKPRRSYEKEIQKSPRPTTEHQPYPATPEDEEGEQSTYLLNQGNRSGKNIIRVRRMGEQQQQHFEEEADKLYGL